MSPYLGLRGGRLDAAIWGLACCCVMIFGYNQSVAGGVLETEAFRRQFPQMAEDATIQGTVVALYTLTGAIGALSCIWLGDLWGRRWTIFVAALVGAIGAILMGTSFSFAQFIVSRLVLGLGVGGIIATTSVWQAELSKPHSRGSHVSAFGIFGGTGLTLASWITFGTHSLSSSFSWRFPFLIQLILPAIVMSSIHLLPESPRWLVKMRREDEAEGVLAALYDFPIDEPFVKQQIRDIRVSLELSEGASIRAMFTMGQDRVLHRTILACSTQMFLQMSGTNAIAYYGPTIFKQYLGFSTSNADIIAACSTLTIALGSIICSFTVDRFGRRTLMLTSATGVACCHAIVAGLVSTGHSAALKAAVFFIFFFNIWYTIGLFGIPFLYASEIAPTHLRASICGLSTAVSWLFNFAIAEITPVAFQNIGYRYFIVFAVFNAFVVPTIYWLYPETANRSLEEIDELFLSSSNIFDPVKVAKRLPPKPLADFVAEETKSDAQASHTEVVNGDK